MSRGPESLYNVLLNSSRTVYSPEVYHRIGEHGKLGDFLDAVALDAVQLIRAKDINYPPGVFPSLSLKRSNEEALEWVNSMGSQLYKPWMHETTDFHIMPSIPIPLTGENVETYGHEGDESGFQFRRKLQYVVDSLRKQTPTVAFEGPRGAGKDYWISRVTEFLSNNYLTRATKLSGFLDTNDDWQRYYSPLDPRAKQILAEDIQWLDAMRRNDSLSIVRAFLKRKYEANSSDSLVDEQTIFAYAIEVAHQWINPQFHIPGDWSWQMLQNIWVGHLNVLYDSESRDGRRGIVVANGGSIARSLYWGFYRSHIFLSDFGEFQLNLLLPAIRKMGEQARQITFTSEPFQLNPGIPDVTFFLDASDEVLAQRIATDSVRPDDMIDRLESVRENAAPLRATMQILSEKFPGKFVHIDTTRPEKEVMRSIKNELSSRNLI